MCPPIVVKFQDSPAAHMEMSPSPFHNMLRIRFFIHISYTSHFHEGLFCTRCEVLQMFREVSPTIWLIIWFYICFSLQMTFYGPKIHKMSLLGQTHMSLIKLDTQSLMRRVTAKIRLSSGRSAKFLKHPRTFRKVLRISSS